MNARVSPRPDDRLDEVDGLRAIAMTMVVAQHCGLAPFGWTGVWLFYVISGFVITRRFILGPDGKVAPGTRYAGFMRRRFFRIVPVYVLYITIGSVACLLAGRTDSLRDLPFLLTFSFNWQNIFQFWPVADAWAPFGHLWTLSVEEQFYVVFPLLFLFLPRRAFITVAVVLVLASPLIRYLMSGFLQGINPDPGFVAYGIYAASFTQFDAFLIGALVASHEGVIRHRPIVATIIGAIAVAAMALYVGAYLAVNHALGMRGIDMFRNIVSGTLAGQHREVFLYSALDLVCASVLIWALRRPPVVRPLGWRPMVFVGRVSYGGYLYHAMVLWIIVNAILGAPHPEMPLGERLFWFVIAWSLTVAVAAMSYRWFEAPIMAWAKGRWSAAGSRPSRLLPRSPEDTPLRAEA